MKFWNIFGVISAWILSLAMVVMLTAAPLALSAMSMLDPETIAEAINEVITKDDSASAEPQNDYGIAQLASKKDKEESVADKILEAVDMQSIERIVGGKIDKDVIEEILDSDAVEELVDAYAVDVINTVVGNSKKAVFTSDKLVEVVEKNLDEIVEIIEESQKGLSAGQKRELKAEIESVIHRKADDIVKTVPAPEEIRDAVVSGELMESVMDFLAKKNTAKLILVGAIILVSLLIFLVRMPGFKGLRWLSTNLFTAGGFNIGICIFLSVGATAVLGAMDGLEGLGVAADGVVGSMIAAFTKGVIVRTVIIFVAAVALLAAYILLKIFYRKKNTKKAEPVVVAEPVMAPVAPAPVAATPVVPVYTAPAVTIEPELITELAPEPAAEPAEECSEEAVEEPASDSVPTEDILL